MSKIKVALLGLMTAIGFGASMDSAQAQIVPGWGYGSRIAVGGTAVTPGLGVVTATSAVDPLWGSQAHYRGYVNPITGASYERQVAVGPLGAYSTVWVNNPTILPYPYPYNPYWNPYLYPTYYTWPYYGWSPQMLAYYRGVHGRNPTLR